MIWHIFLSPINFFWKKGTFKVLLSKIHFVILPVSQHVFLLGFFLYACVFDTYQIFECGNQNYYKKLHTYYIFRIMGNFSSILSIKSLQLFILRNDDLFIMRQNYKVYRRKLIGTNFDHEFSMCRVLEFKLQDFT